MFNIEKKLNEIDLSGLAELCNNHLQQRQMWRKNISKEEIHLSVKNTIIVIAEFILERLDD
jgi:hypothetical protein